MKCIAIATAMTSLIASTLAAPVAENSVSGTSAYTWDVTHWKAECTGSGCTYAFHISGEEDGIYPGFTAYCTGGDYGTWQTCKLLSASTTSSTDPAVSAKLKPENHRDPNNVAAMSVEFTFTHKKNDYTFIGHHAATFDLDNGGPTAFEITPSQASVVKF